MDVSPSLLTRSAPSALPDSQLATLLAEACRELESLRQEASFQRDRAHKAEKLVKTLSTLRGQPSVSHPTPAHSTSATSPSSAPGNPPIQSPATTVPSNHLSSDEAIRLVLEHEERANRAEQERDEAVSRRYAINEYWSNLQSYIAQVDSAAFNARFTFDLIIKDAAPHLALSRLPPSADPSYHIINGQRLQPPPYPPTTGPVLSSIPPPHPTGLRRARTPSLDSHRSPPQKRLRSDHAERPHSYLTSQPVTHHLTQSQLPPLNTHGASPEHHQPRIIFPPSSSHHLPLGSARPSIHPSSGPEQTLSHAQELTRYRRHSRSSGRHSVRKSTSPDRSSEASMSVDEMLLEIADGSQEKPLTAISNPPPNGQHFSLTSSDQRIRRSGSTRGEVDRSQPGPVDTYEYPRSSRYPDTAPPSAAPPLSSHSSSTGALHASAQAASQQQFQTHVFAPVVTGAPQKKSKFPGSGAAPLPPSGGTLVLGAGEAGSAGTAQLTPFPPTNEQGQRICRQCGMAGRYKDGKCVEKWGPGPMGPGTVCDRCRKKMKRVERRGTMELQQLQAHAQHQHQIQRQASNLTGRSAPGPIPSSTSATQLPIQRTDTLPAHHRTGKDDATSYHSPRLVRPSSPTPRPASRPPSTASGGGAKQSQFSPTVPGIIVLNEGDESTRSDHRRGVGGNASLTVPLTRSASRTGSSPRRPGSGGSRTGSRNASRSPAGSGNVSIDAEGSAEPDPDAEHEAEGETGSDAEGELVTKTSASVEEGDVPGRRQRSRTDNEADPDAYLLEAVDAAEANSIASSAGSEDDLA